MSVKLPSHAYLIIVLQITFLILFGIFSEYADDANATKNPGPLELHPNEEGVEHDPAHQSSYEPNNAHVNTYPMFQDVHVMIFIGFGFLMTFLKRYGFSAVGINFLLASLSLQWALLVNGFFHLHHGRIQIDLNSLLGADFTAAAVLISFGALLGKANPSQLIIMVMVEIPVFAINEVIGRKYLGAIDIGDSMFVHVFGAYFGIAVSFMLYRPDCSTSKEGSSYNSDIFAMIGTVFLWIYWPSFNAGAAPGDDQHRAVINTYLSLAACCITAFAMSSILNSERKFDMVHIQNSTLAGGVIVGTSADMMLNPIGALICGVIAGVISVWGYKFLTPFLSSKCRIHDTCGVNNLHGMPGILAGIIGVVMSAIASEDSYGLSLYQLFPSRSPVKGSPDLARLQLTIPDLEAGSGTTASSQAVNQLLALIISLVMAIVGGLITGLILRLGPFQNLESDDLYEDSNYWILEEDEEEHEYSVANVMHMNDRAETNKVAVRHA